MILALRFGMRMYKAWPFRPHCSVRGCVLACRLSHPVQSELKERCFWRQRDHPPLVPYP